MLLQCATNPFQLLVKQEITRKVGLALTPEEEAIRGHLESLQPHMYAPTHLKVRVASIQGVSLSLQLNCGSEYCHFCHFREGWPSYFPQ